MRRLSMVMLLLGGCPEERGYDTCSGTHGTRVMYAEDSDFAYSDACSAACAPSLVASSYKDRCVCDTRFNQPDIVCNTGKLHMTVINPVTGDIIVEKDIDSSERPAKEALAAARHHVIRFSPCRRIWHVD